ncbi:hypothetical protein [Rhizobium laguerreae]|uniref:hypothetical protein n=1 Tax=Rhizobium laguerreae TaxID=1076926 RepID=UPI00300A4249
MAEVGLGWTGFRHHVSPPYGPIRITKWDESVGVPKPSDNDVAAALAAPEPMSWFHLRPYLPLKLQMLAEDLLDHVEAWVAEQPKAVQIAFDCSGSFVKSEQVNRRA